MPAPPHLAGTIGHGQPLCHERESGRRAQTSAAGGRKLALPDRLGRVAQRLLDALRFRGG